MIRSGQMCALAMLAAFEQPLPNTWVFEWYAWLRALSVAQLEIALAILAKTPHSPVVRSRLAALDLALDWDPTFIALRREMQTRSAAAVYK